MKRITCTLAVLLSQTLLAQTSGPAPAPDAPPPSGAPAGRSMSALTLGMPGEASLERLKEKLRLTPEQEPLWRVFQQRVDACVGLIYRERPVTPTPDQAAPRQVARLVDQAQNRLAALEDMERAAKSLYESLDIEQQKVANAGMLQALPPMLTGQQALADEGRRMERSENNTGRSRRGGMGGPGGMGGGRY